MKTKLLLTSFLLLVGHLSGSAYTSAQTNDVVRSLLLGPESCKTDTPEFGVVYIVPDYSNPDVFFGRSTPGDWTRVEKEAAFNEFLENMWRIDFSAQEAGRPNVMSAVYQCVEMHYTNAVPAIRRLILNRTFPDWARRTALQYCMEICPVDDEMTSFIEIFFTNRVDYALKDREVAWEYIDKVTALRASNAVSRAVSDRALRMVYERHDPLEWELSPEYDRFMTRNFEDYVLSSNRLAFLSTMLVNTNLTQDSFWDIIKNRYISATNQILSSGQPLRQWSIDGGTNE